MWGLNRIGKDAVQAAAQGDTFYAPDRLHLLLNGFQGFFNGEGVLRQVLTSG
jgi:hypothetical protein